MERMDVQIIQRLAGQGQNHGQRYDSQGQIMDSSQFWSVLISIGRSPLDADVFQYKTICTTFPVFCVVKVDKVPARPSIIYCLVSGIRCIRLSLFSYHLKIT